MVVQERTDLYCRHVLLHTCMQTRTERWPTSTTSSTFTTLPTAVTFVPTLITRGCAMSPLRKRAIASQVCVSVHECCSMRVVCCTCMWCSTCGIGICDMWRMILSIPLSSSCHVPHHPPTNRGGAVWYRLSHMQCWCLWSVCHWCGKHGCWVYSWHW